jgi:uncharacterized protein
MRVRPMSIAVAVFFLAFAPLSGAPAAAQAPAPETLAAARDLVAASRAADQLKTLLPLIMQQLKQAIVRGDPAAARDFDAVMPPLIEAMSARSAAFADGIALVYARNFTVDELRQIADFYRGPAGQRFLDKMPVVAQETMTMGQQFGQEIAGEMRSRIIDELRKRGHDL